MGPYSNEVGFPDSGRRNYLSTRSDFVRPRLALTRPWWGYRDNQVRVIVLVALVLAIVAMLLLR